MRFECGDRGGRERLAQGHNRDVAITLTLTLRGSQEHGHRHGWGTHTVLNLPNVPGKYGQLVT